MPAGAAPADPGSVEGSDRGDRTRIRESATALSKELKELRAEKTDRTALAGLLVVDGTRRETLEKAVVLQNRTEETIGKVPFVLVVNKADLVEKWEIDEAAIEELGKRGWPAFKTSAKTGEGVDQAFLALARRMAGAPGP